MSTEWDILVATASQSGASDAISFAALPFLAVPALPSRNDGDVLARYGQSRLALLRALDWFLANEVDVVNLSLAVAADEPFDLEDPLQVATRALDVGGAVVVVAAGNDGPAADTLQPLARPEWVISVGATDSRGALLKTSSRGIRGGAQPSLVADGTDPSEPPFEPGTSFAAPRISALAAWLKIALVLAARDYEAAQSHLWHVFSEPIPFPRIGFADTGANPCLWSKGSQLARSFLDKGEDEVRVGRTSREHHWYQAVARFLGRGRLPFDPDVTPTIVREALSDTARHVPGGAPETVGAGYVSVTEVEDYLARLTPSRWLSLFGVPPLGRAARALDELGPVWDGVKVEALRDLFFRGIRPYVAKVT